jgi:hypothetical protein
MAQRDRSRRGQRNSANSTRAVINGLAGLMLKKQLI